MTFKLEYPWPIYCDQDPKFFDNITMLDISFQTTIHYFKNHDNDFEELIIKLLGFGLRIERRK